ncbi:hypothetical protein [Spongiibacter sp.]|uniref:hypothetical protein n=1 Tax=Spongiibacter sp. TaxID=2024860 RepID=UPI001B2EDD6E|nr:hypothetical protein [Spongiibacter sp.]MBO6753331.1 hypothetical protein [Spongiibacter sp.]
MKTNRIMIVALAIAALAVVLLEVFTADQKISKTETALFSVLQFIFSIGFAWLLSKDTSKTEFEEQQKKFATAAFRRIKEIEFQINHIIKRINNALSSESSNFEHELDIARTMAISVNETTQSSKLDWADVIGDQIEAIDKIEDYQRSILNSSESTDSNETGELFREKIDELKKSLSKELRLLVEEKKKPSTKRILQKEFESENALRLKGFVDADWPNARDRDKLCVGEKIVIRLADQDDRIATLAAFDENDDYIGSFINRYGNSYSEFTTAVCQVLGASSFEGEIIEVRKAKNDSERLYFTVIATPSGRA